MSRILLEQICVFCRLPHYVTVNEVDYESYVEGVSAQKAFPELSAEEREQIISSICPKCQTRIFH